MEEKKKKFMKVEEVAELLGVKPAAVRSMAFRGALGATWIKVGQRLIRFDEEALFKFLDRRRGKSAGARV